MSSALSTPVSPHDACPSPSCFAELGEYVPQPEIAIARHEKSTRAHRNRNATLKLIPHPRIHSVPDKAHPVLILSY